MRDITPTVPLAGNAIHLDWEGAVGDGSTDDNAAILRAYDALPSSGGTIIGSAGKRYKSNETISFTKPVVIRGEGMGRDLGTRPTTFEFPDGVGGFDFQTGSNGSAVYDCALISSAATATASAHGIRVRSSRAILQNVLVYRFGGMGVFWDGGGNCNNGEMYHGQVLENRSGGVGTDGIDANALKFYGVDSSGNGVGGVGYGFVMLNTNALLIGCHTSANEEGCVYDAGGSNTYIANYVEAAEKFVIDTGSSWGRLIPPAGHAYPDIWSFRSGSLHNDELGAVQMGWKIERANRNARWIEVYDPLSSTTGARWRITAGSPSENDFELRFVQDNPVVSAVAMSFSDALDRITMGVPMLVPPAGGFTVGQNDANLIGMHGLKTARPTVTGSRGGNAALADLLTKLAAKGIILDGTS